MLYAKAHKREHHLQGVHILRLLCYKLLEVSCARGAVQQDATLCWLNVAETAARLYLLLLLGKGSS